MPDTLINDDYRSLFVDGVPLLDVRAPTEFAQGSFPNAINLPLLTDDERHAVGLTFNREGQAAAIAVGQVLVAGHTREARLQAWLDWYDRSPTGQLYCFRGGMRSGTVQRWLRDAGRPIPRVHGGYKAMRRFLLESLETNAAALPLALLCGRTGAGKTRVIEKLGQTVDLEGLARHRGSAFGRRPGGQPTQVDFENALAIRLLQLHARQEQSGPLPVVVEDESRLVGHRLIPPALYLQMKVAPRVLIEEPLEDRVQLILEDYVIRPLGEYACSHGERHALPRLAAELLGALDRIHNRLGGARHRDLRHTMETALAIHAETGDTRVHRGWIRELLCGYYDPLYDHALRIRDTPGPPLFVGSRQEVTSFLLDLLSRPQRAGTRL